MADDWKPGDLALIVKQGAIPCPGIGNIHTGRLSPPAGAIRTVVSVGPSRLDNGELCGCTDIDFTDGTGAVTQRARKIEDHTPDADDAETIRLLTGKPVRERV